jgi:hypothetical protein
MSPSTPLYDSGIRLRTVQVLHDAGINTCGELLEEYERRGEQSAVQVWARNLDTKGWEEVRLIVQTLINDRWLSERRRPPL